MNKRKTNSSHRFMVSTIFMVFITTIHRPVTKNYNPWSAYSANTQAKDNKANFSQNCDSPKPCKNGRPILVTVS